MNQWAKVGNLNVSSGHLSVSDSSYFFDDYVVVHVLPGVHDVLAAIDDFDGHKHVTMIRVVSSEKVSRGTKCGVISVDFAQIGLCDRDAVLRSFDQLGDAGMPMFYEQLQIKSLFSRVSLPEGVDMIIVRPAFGDGSYDVYNAVDVNGRICGVEIDCMSATERGMS